MDTQVVAGISLICVILIVAFIGWWNGRKPNHHYRSVLYTIRNTTGTRYD